MKDVRVPAQLMRAMAAEAEAAREARAKVIIISTIIIHMLLLLLMMRLMMLMTWAIHPHHHHQVIAAEGEHKASRALKHAADVIADSPAALQVT